MSLRFAALAKQAKPLPPAWQALLLVPLAALLGILLLLGVTRPAYAGPPLCSTPITVTSNADSGAGTLREAITKVCADGTINFDPSLNNSVITLTSELEVSQNVTITGPGAELLSISGDDLVRVLNISNNAAHVNLDGLTIRNGATFQGGSGIRNTGILTLTHTVVRDNTSTNIGLGGGGILNFQGQVTLIESVIRDNQTDATASSGAGINNENGTVIVISSTIHNNQTKQVGSDGAGIYNRGTLTITNSYVTSNTVAGTASNGGGIWTLARALIAGTVISGNTTLAAGTNGAGIYIAENAIYTIITDTLIQGNQAAAKGAGIYKASNTSVSLTNSTVADNSTSETEGVGGGIYNDSGLFTIVNSQITDNQTTGNSAHGGGLYNALAATLDISLSTISDNATLGQANGAGIYTQGVLTMTESIVQGNHTSSGTERDGGGIFTNGTTTIERSFIGDNFAGTSGGGILRNLGALTVVNSTIYSNTTELDDGGGVVVFGNANPATFLHTTFAYNKAGNDTGDAIWNEYAEAISVTNSLFVPGGLTNSITATVSAQCAGLIITDTTSNLGLESSCNSTSIPTPLLFRMGELGTYGGKVPVLPLLPTHLAIDSVNLINSGTACTATDARGVARPQGIACDFGAFESHGFSMTISGGNNQSAVVNTAFALPFSVHLTNAYSEPVDGGIVAFSPPENGANVTFAQPFPFTLIENGSAAITGTANMTSGVYSLAARHSFFNPLASVAFTLTNTGLPSSNALTSSPNPSIYGELLTITSTVTPSDATGEVVYYVNGNYYSTDTLGANATLTSSTSLLPPGVYTITAYYSGSATYEGSTSSVYTHTVLKIDTSTSVTSNPNPSLINDNIVFTATVSPDSIIVPTGEIGVQTSNPFAGNVEFYDDTSLLDSIPIDESGIATYTTGLPVGDHPITAVYVGNDYYSSSTTGVYTQTVTKHATESALEVAPNPVTVGDMVSFTATVSSDFVQDSINIETSDGPTGDVSFYINGQLEGLGTIEANGVATYTTTIFMPAGSYTVTAEYDGAKYYSTSASNAVVLVVNKINTSVELTSDLNPSEVDQSVLFTATVTPDALLLASLGEIGIQGGSPFAGDVEFYDGVDLLGSNSIDENGVTTFATNSLEIGDRAITALYVGNDYFDSSTSIVYTQTVIQHATESVLEIAPNPVTFADPVTFTTTVSSEYLAGSFGVQYQVNPLAGTVILYQGVTPSYVPVQVDANGVATYTTYAFAPAGLYTFTALYEGNEKYKTSTSNQVALLVNKATTTTTLESGPNPSFYGQSVTLTATVSSDVLFNIGSLGLGGEVETQSPSYYYGNVIFKEGANTLGTGTLDGNGIATFTTNSLPVGSYTITAEFEGNVYFVGSTSNSVIQVVTQATTESTLVVAPNPVTFGEWLAFTTTISSDYLLTHVGTQEAVNLFEGDVTYYVNGQENDTTPVDENGVAVDFGYAFVPAGNYSITAVYGGNAGFGPSTSNEVILVVNKAPTTVGVVSSLNPSTYGKGVTFTASVGGDVTPTSMGVMGESLSAQGGGGYFSGDVTFKDGVNVLGTATIDEGGVATLTTNSLLPGNHEITVEYAGNAYYASSTSGNLTQVVNKIATTASVVSDLNPAVEGDLVTFTASVDGELLFESAGVEIASVNPLSGNVTFKNGANTLGVGTLDGNGAATFSTSGLPVGTHNITAVYAGNTLFDGSTSSNLSQVVNQVGKIATTVGIVSDLNPSVAGDLVTFSASVASLGIDVASVNPLSGNVTFKNEANTLGIGTLNGDGVATFSTNALPVGTHNVTAVYEGNETFAGSTSSNLSQVVNGEEEPPVAPVAVNDAAGTLEAVAVSVAVLDNDVNHSNGALSIQSITQPSHGSASVNGGNVVYTPAAGFSGLDTFTYTVVDGNSLTNVATVAIVVSAQAASGQAAQVAIINNESDGDVTFTGDDAALELTLPSGIYTGTLTDKDVFYLVLTWIITPSEGNSGNLQFANLSFDLSAYLNGNKLEHFVFGEPITMKISYADTLLGGLSPESLQLLFLDGDTWNNSGIEIVGHDVDARSFEVRISHLSEFALFAVSPTNLPNTPQPNAQQVQLFMPRLGN